MRVNMTVFEQAIRREWLALSVDYCRRLIYSMYRRLKALKKADFYNIKY